MSNELGIGFLRALLQHRTPSGDSLCFDTTALSGLQLDSIRASPGRLTATMPVSDAVANRYGTLHGGCIGALGGGALLLHLMTHRGRHQTTPASSRLAAAGTC